MSTPVTLAELLRQNWIHWPSPLADQRVLRLLSSTLAGTLPSSELAVTGVQAGVPPGKSSAGVSILSRIQAPAGFRRPVVQGPLEQVPVVHTAPLRKSSE